MINYMLQKPIRMQLLVKSDSVRKMETSDANDKE